jgi:hypothetical protein
VGGRRDDSSFNKKGVGHDMTEPHIRTGSVDDTFEDIDDG